MNKTLKFSLAISTLVLLSACTAKWKLQCKHESEGEFTCGGSIPVMQASIFRPILNLIASSGAFSYEDWYGLDVASYSFKVDESYSTTTINYNKVNIKVFNSAIEIGSKEFEVYKTGDSYRFSFPGLVKDWSQNFIDSADQFQIDIVTSSSGIEGATTTVSLEENGATLDGTSITYQSVPYHNDGPGEWMEK